MLILIWCLLERVFTQKYTHTLRNSPSIYLTLKTQILIRVEIERHNSLRRGLTNVVKPSGGCNTFSIVKCE